METPSKLHLLQDVCCRAASAHINDFPLDHLLRLPLKLRYKLLQNICAVDLWRTEVARPTFVDCVDIEKVWEIRNSLIWKNMRCSDLSCPSVANVSFLDRISAKEAYFQALWATLGRILAGACRDVSVSEELSVVQTLLFEAPFTPDPFATIREVSVTPALSRLRAAVSAHSQTEERVRLSRECVKEVLEAVLNTGYRPSYLTCDRVLDSLEEEQKWDIIKELVSKVSAVSTTSEAIKRRWFKQLLASSTLTLRLGLIVSSCALDLDRALEAKKIDQLVMYVADEAETLFKSVTEFLQNLLQLHPVRMLQVTAPILELWKVKPYLVNLSYALIALLKKDTFRCLRLSGLTTTTTARCIVSTFLTTPCSTTQVLELYRMYSDRDSKEPSADLETVKLDTNNLGYSLKSLALDSIGEQYGKHCRMLCYWKAETFDPNRESVVYGSISHWLLSLPHLKVGSLELWDYCASLRNTRVSSSLLVRKITIVLVQNERDQNTRRNAWWSSKLFQSLLANQRIEDFTWHSRYKDPALFNKDAALKGLSSSLAAIDPLANFKKVRISVDHPFKNAISVYASAVVV